MMPYVFIALGALLGALNLYASVRCYRDRLSPPGQRAAQIAFIWLVPLLGAALALRLSQPEQPGIAHSRDGEADEEAEDFDDWTPNDPASIP